MLLEYKFDHLLSSIEIHSILGVQIELEILVIIAEWALNNAKYPFPVTSLRFSYF